MIPRHRSKQKPSCNVCNTPWQGGVEPSWMTTCFGRLHYAGSVSETTTKEGIRPLEYSMYYYGIKKAVIERYSPRQQHKVVVYAAGTLRKGRGGTLLVHVEE